ncbi:hypothetical protein [Gloeocapsa sp. PCC 73106]|uniref:hypothetical protein n=1 Tax=Gloeocapsa sp. PCC 73106 TaxID=102232 RepID=UPI0002ABE636|nr:hypothetical protein [Gloeocapsa sp. PCC 73106]ELR97431.1 hypothetical protein GLO73106DRAFT_00012410 [Gloeocapsa sp. PCC 73106]
MNKQLISSFLIAGTVIALVPQLAEAALQSGKRYGRASNLPGFRYSLFAVPDSNLAENQGFFARAIVESGVSEESLENVGIFFAIPEADLLSSFNGDKVTYTFRATAENQENIGIIIPDFSDPTSEFEIRTPIGGEFYTFSLDISGESPAIQSQYINDIDFILNNDILAQSVTIDAAETLTVARVDDPNVTIELNTGGAPTRDDCELSGQDFVSLVDSGFPSGICFSNVERVVEEPIPETNVLSGLAGLVMIGLFKIVNRQKS